MRITTLASMAALYLAVAASPLTVAGFDIAAMAKNGNGGGNGGGNGSGNGGGNRDNSGGPGRSSPHDNSKAHGDTAKGNSGEAGSQSQSRKAGREATVSKRKASDLAGLNSLNRSYKAYLHTSDPRMSAISAYAVAYAQYELHFGAEPSVDDPILGDQALKDALTSATKTAEVSPAALARAKSVLGVGDANGKIDQIRATLKQRTQVDGDDPAVIQPD